MNIVFMLWNSQSNFKFFNSICKFFSVDLSCDDGSHLQNLDIIKLLSTQMKKLTYSYYHVCIIHVISQGKA